MSAIHVYMHSHVMYVFRYYNFLVQKYYLLSSTELLSVRDLPWKLFSQAIDGNYREKMKDLCMVFIDIEKVYDRVLREKRWMFLYVHVIKDMHYGNKSLVKNSMGEISDLPTAMGLHQGSEYKYL